MVVSTSVFPSLQAAVYPVTQPPLQPLLPCHKNFPHGIMPSNQQLPIMPSNQQLPVMPSNQQLPVTSCLFCMPSPFICHSGQFSEGIVTSPTLPNALPPAQFVKTSASSQVIPPSFVIPYNQSRLIDSSSLSYFYKCSVPPPPSPLVWKQSYGMEQVWQNEFKNLFSQYSPYMWLLYPVFQRPPGIWYTNVDSAKVRFCCEECGHGWTSMKGRAAFWFILNVATGEGTVCLKLYGQQCDRCKSGNYEPAMWYPEEVVRVLINIYHKVGEIYYGFQQAPYNKDRRPGKPRTPHNSELCQACKDGVCSERR